MSGPPPFHPQGPFFPGLPDGQNFAHSESGFSYSQNTHPYTGFVRGGPAPQWASAGAALTKLMTPRDRAYLAQAPPVSAFRDAFMPFNYTNYALPPARAPPRMMKRPNPPGA